MRVNARKNSYYFQIYSFVTTEKMEVLFPLKEIVWEGEKFWVPNDAEEFLTYEYERPWEFPDDVGIPLHYEAGNKDI